MHNVSIPKFVGQVALYKILDKSKHLNDLAAHITGGSITRNGLAKDIIAKTISLGQDYVASNKMLGKRSAEIVYQGRSVLFGNTLEQVDSGIGPLVELILRSKGQGQLAQKMAAGIAQFLGPTLLQDHAIERVLVALTQQPGGENVLKMALDNVLSGYFGGKIISATFMSALKRAVLDRPEYKPISPLHHMAAWKIHQALTHDPDSLPPPPAGLKLIDAIVGNLPGFVTSVYQKLDNLQNILQLPLSEKELSTVFTECWPSDLAVTKDMLIKDFARVVMMAHATDQDIILDKNISALPPVIGESFQRQCKDIRAFLSRMPTPEVKVAQNWSGGIESVSVNHSKDQPPSPNLVDYMGNKFRASVHHPQAVGTHFADGAFVEVFKAGIDLKVDNSHQSYVSWAATMGTQYISQAKNMLWKQHELTNAQQRQLEQLSDIVDHNPMSLMALSRYLIPENIIKSVQKEVLSQFTFQQPDLILSDNIWMKVSTPEVSFVVSKNKGVDIDITLKWPVSEFGKAVDSLEISQSNQGNLTSTVKVHLLLNDNGVEKQEISISDTHISLREQLSFASEKDVVMDSPITFLNLGVLKKAFEMVSSC